ncbi:MAG: TetR/AcrR family transcriptional regulator, partial [Pseudonocardia sp.]|nr:TetR/AcrR family transcriptional regulator [Pseudonocardia sp.]
LAQRARPAFDALAADGRGLPAIREFFAGLVDVRCSGSYAGWGCMIVNAHVGLERDDPEVRALLDEHHRRLRDALRAALETAGRRGELSEGASADTAAEVLALLAYGVNLRSRAGADADTLHATVAAALEPLAR